MTDYYMGFSAKNGGIAEWGKWNSILRNMAIGETFTVDTDQDRHTILSVSNRIGVRVRSRKLDNAGYEIQRINIGAPRKRGHPKRHII